MAAESQITVLIALNDNPDSVQDRFDCGDKPYQELIKILQGIAAGTERGNVLYHIDEADGTAASNTAAFTYSSGADGDTVTVCGIVFTARTSPSADPSLGEFGLDTDDDTTSGLFAAAVNAHPKMKGLMTGANSSGTTTLTMTAKGVHGNLGTLATSNASFVTVGGAAFSSGAAGTVQKVLSVDRWARNI